MADKKPFEKVFPYFSYRWRYNDGQYSPYAPFTKAAFFPKDPDVEDFIKKGHNTAIVNDVELVNLKDISKGGPDVVAVDILYTESISSTIYILSTVEIPKDERGNGVPLTFQITKRSFKNALPDAELSRHFDNVPRKAKAQEITANRLMYGNYVEKYDYFEPGTTTPLSLKIELSTTKTPLPLNGPSLKGNRTYEVAVAYIDEFGRIGGLLTQPLSNSATEGSVIKTDFTSKNRVSLSAKIKSDPPSWAKFYRYYIKDISGEHFNLSSFNVYNEGTRYDEVSDNVYLQFNSTDRNKITDDTILIPRKHNFNGSSNIFNEESRHPVLAIENEAPAIVKNQVAERDFTRIIKFLDSEENVAKASASFTNGGAFTNAATTVGQTSLYLLLGDREGAVTRYITPLNDYISSQNPDASRSDNTLLYNGWSRGNNSVTAQTEIDLTGFEDLLVGRIVDDTVSDNSRDTDYFIIESVQLLSTSDKDYRNVLKFTLGTRVDYNTKETIAGNGISKAGIDWGSSATGKIDLFLYKMGLTDDGADKLKGSFFVKVPRQTTAGTITEIPTGQTEYSAENQVGVIKEISFETEPVSESNLNLFWESSNTFSVQDSHGRNNTIDFANCIATVDENTKNVYLESTKLFDKFNTVEIAKGVRVLTPEERYNETRRKSSIIFSGLFNSKTGINDLNRFSTADVIHKDLEPNYGGIQKLYALDTNLLAFTEDKVFRILADKDALFNADEGVNVTSTNLVLGQAMAYQGNYGISTHPESFAYFRNNIYFTDAKRGSVMQLTPSNGQLFPISSSGMSNFWRDRISTADKLIGAYDGTKKMYVLSMQGYDQNAASIGSETIPNETSNITLGYSFRTEGWTSRYSFIPESGVTLNNKFYTFKNGKAYLHNSDTSARNNFYGTQYSSEVQVIFNDNPAFVSDWLSLNYEGSSDWEATEIIGDQDSTYSITNVRILDSEESGFLGWFLKEGKYHGAIVGTQPVYIIDPAGSVGADGFWPLIQDGNNTQDISGTKGFFTKIRFKNSGTTAKELFAISSEYYISQS